MVAQQNSERTKLFSSNSTNSCLQKNGPHLHYTHVKAQTPPFSVNLSFLYMPNLSLEYFGPYH